MFRPAALILCLAAEAKPRFFVCFVKHGFKIVLLGTASAVGGDKTDYCCFFYCWTACLIEYLTCSCGAGFIVWSAFCIFFYSAYIMQERS